MLLDLSCTSQTPALEQNDLCPGVYLRCSVRLHFTNPTSVPSCPSEQPQCLNKPLLLLQNLDLSLPGSAQ